MTVAKVQPELDAALRLVVRWNPRMRSAAGRAFWPTCRIDLNPALLPHGQRETWATILHELAHLVAYARYGTRIKPHGPEWRHCCALLGIPGESRTHSLPLPRRSLERKFYYFCPHCGWTITRVRAMKKPSACAACCRAHNGGRFHKNFVFVKLPTADDWPS